MAKKKGICKNYDNECSLCENKIVQEVDKDNFICEECGGELTEVKDKASARSGISMPVIAIIALALILIVSLCAYLLFSDSDVKISDLKFAQTEYELVIGDSAEVLVEAMPIEANGKTVVWSSSDPKVVCVENGMIKAVAQGDAVVTAKSDDSDACATANVRVVPAKPCPEIGNGVSTMSAIESITVIPATCSIKESETMELTVVIVPEEASDAALIWKSSNPNVAEVDNGVITGKSKGEATVYVVSSDGKATSEVHVSVKTGVGESVATQKPSKSTTLIGASFTGTTKNGVPHGRGILTYARRQLIDSHDEKKRVAEAGEYVSGIWFNGHLIQGTYHMKDGSAIYLDFENPESNGHTSFDDPFFKKDHLLYK